MAGAAAMNGASARPRDAAMVSYVAFIYLFFYLPIAVIVLFAFNVREIPALPIEGLTTDWFDAAITDPKLMEALWASTWIATVTAAAPSWCRPRWTVSVKSSTCPTAKLPTRSARLSPKSPARSTRFSRT